MTVYVEWNDQVHGTGDLQVVDTDTGFVFDTLKFHTFTSVIIVLGGWNQVPSPSTNDEQGVFLIADEIYKVGAIARRIKNVPLALAQNVLEVIYLIHERRNAS